jgi:hypothetical protein
MHCYVIVTGKYGLQSLIFFRVPACFKYTVDWLKTSDVQVLRSTTYAAEFLWKTKIKGYMFLKTYKMCFWKINALQSWIP